MDSVHIELAVIEMNLIQKASNFGVGVFYVAFPSSCVDRGGLVAVATLPRAYDSCFSWIHIV
tara:strand:- start:5736 stop:5921 length:186 start_codon:yes stop_codon:yes gene_type:complete